MTYCYQKCAYFQAHLGRHITTTRITTPRPTTNYAALPLNTSTTIEIYSTTDSRASATDQLRSSIIDRPAAIGSRTVTDAARAVTTGTSHEHMLTHIVDLIRQWRFWKQKRRRERDRHRRTMSYEYLPTAAQLAASAAYDTNHPHTTTGIYDTAMPASTSGVSSGTTTTSTTTTTSSTTPSSSAQRLQATQYLDLANTHESFNLVEEELQQMQKTVVGAKKYEQN